MAKRIPTEELLSELRRLKEEIGRTPSYKDMDEYGEFSHQTYQARYGTWGDALQEVGFGRTDQHSSGEDHYNWNGGGGYGPNWREQRQNCILRDSGKCRGCGVSMKEHLKEHGRELEVHHITPVREFDDCEKQNALSNLITLCAACHGRWEGIPLKPEKHIGGEA